MSQRQPLPRLTFFCELEPEALKSLFSQTAVIDSLLELKAGVSLGLLDFSSARAEVIRQLNRAGVPVIAWQLLPYRDGYWYHMHCVPEATQRYQEFVQWSQQETLVWAGVGIDIEPEVTEFQALLSNKWKWLAQVRRRGIGKKKLLQAQQGYCGLIDKIRRDGFHIDSYELLFLTDERKAGSTLLQRFCGIADMPSDRRVLMLYSSYFRPFGEALVWGYGRRADSIAIGSTGGGIQLEGVTSPPALQWSEFSRDLCIARQCVDDIHIFSLEGCVSQGNLQRLCDFDWQQPVQANRSWCAAVVTLRALFVSLLWASARPVVPILLVIGLLWWGVL